MRLKKKELIFSIVMAIILLFAGCNLSALATSSNGSQTFNWTIGVQNKNTSNSINVIETNKDEPINTINTIVTNNSTNNTSGTVPNTGLEDLPWVMIGICAVSLVFAYKKIKEYNDIV